MNNDFLTCYTFYKTWHSTHFHRWGWRGIWTVNFTSTWWTSSHWHVTFSALWVIWKANFFSHSFQATPLTWRQEKESPPSIQYSSSTTSTSSSNSTDESSIHSNTHFKWPRRSKCGWSTCYALNVEINTNQFQKFPCFIISCLWTFRCLREAWGVKVWFVTRFNSNKLFAVPRDFLDQL